MSNGLRTMRSRVGTGVSNVRSNMRNFVETMRQMVKNFVLRLEAKARSDNSPDYRGWLALSSLLVGTILAL